MTSIAGWAESLEQDLALLRGLACQVSGLDVAVASTLELGDGRDTGCDIFDTLDELRGSVTSG